MAGPSGITVSLIIIVYNQNDLWVENESMGEFQYLAFNKPFGVLSNFTDQGGRETLKRYIPIEGVYSAGRLDKESEGLMILTDDGALIHHLTDPRHHLPKTYLVQVEGYISQAALVKLEAGVIIHGLRTKRCQAMQVPDPALADRSKPITPHGPTNWLRIVIREGKKHQIRHMTASVGLPTLRLVRVAIGPLVLGTLKPGEWRELMTNEVELLRKSR
jgi:23S rRNA pseudouridine2457 synthase